MYLSRSKHPRLTLFVVLYAATLGGVAIAASDDDTPSKLGPRASIDEKIFDFGEITLQEVRDHAFVIKNVGDEPLEIKKVVASCKCVLTQDVAEFVEPGDSVEVRVSFKGKPTKDRYNQSVTIATNDPTQPELILKIVGVVTKEFFAAPSSIRFNRVARGESLNTFFEVHSGIWEDFEIQSIESSNDAITFETIKFDESQTKVRETKSGWNIKVSIDGSRINENFSDDIFVVVRPTDGKSSAKTLKVPIDVSLKGSIRLTGKGVSMAGRLELHRIDVSQDFDRTFLLKVSDPDGRLNLVNKEVTPNFVDIELEPYRESENTSLYRLNLSVPANKLQSAYIGPSAGKMHLEFDHPRIKSFTMRLELLPDNPYEPK